MMTPYYDHAGITIYHGDVRSVLPSLPEQSVQCCVTSPPYWGLRDYGVDGQLGLEPTPDEYVASMVAVFREVRRVLRDDGTLWLNLGDSYAGARSEGGGTMAGFNDRYFGRETDGGKQAAVDTSKPSRPPVVNLKPKDLVGIPWRVAFALQADGWYLRSDIIWAKPNPMPESITDRPTKAHEYLFLLSKSERYYYDLEAIREEVKPSSGENMRAPKCGRDRVYGTSQQTAKVYDEIKGANARTVWSITTQPFKEAHFAVMPEELARRCIVAGTRKGDTVLDPFNGAGTVGYVAKENNRKAIGIELNADYIGIAARRLEQEVLPL